MSKYNYKARDEKGAPIEGELEAVSQEAAVKQLIDNGYTPVSVEVCGVVFSLMNMVFDLRGLNSKDLLIFFKQLAVLVSSGVPIFESLDAVAEQLPEGKLKKIVASLKVDIELGTTLSQALAHHPGVFSPLIVAMVEGGEKGGVLPDVLKKISGFLENDLVFRQKIINTMRYPLIVLGVLSVAFVFMVTFIIPKFQTVFQSFDTALPLPTQILLALNFVMVNYWWLIVIFIGLAYYSLRWYLSSEAGQIQKDRFVLRLPVIGLILRQLSLARFFRMLSAMISSGVPIERSLEITAATADNSVIAKAINSIRERVLTGSSLSGAMKETKLFPVTSIHMVAVGEKTGQVEDMLIKSADYFNEDADYLVANIMSYFEPLLILCLALFVMLFALGIFLPMWDTMKLYQGQ